MCFCSKLILLPVVFFSPCPHPLSLALCFYCHVPVATGTRQRDILNRIFSAFSLPHLFSFFLCHVPMGSPSRGGDGTVYVFAHTFFNSVLAPVSVFMALSTVFHSINSPDNSQFSHSVLLVLSLPYSILVLSTIYLFMKVSLSPDVILCG